MGWSSKHCHLTISHIHSWMFSLKTLTPLEWYFQNSGVKEGLAKSRPQQLEQQQRQQQLFIWLYVSFPPGKDCVPNVCQLAILTILYIFNIIKLQTNSQKNTAWSPFSRIFSITKWRWSNSMAMAMLWKLRTSGCWKLLNFSSNAWSNNRKTYAENICDGQTKIRGNACWIYVVFFGGWKPP